MEPAPTNNNNKEEPKKKICPKDFKFTRDEIRVMKECKSESFWQRSLPLSTALGVATYYAVNEGYLKKNARFGAAPKVLLAVVVGFFAGKFSYRHRCAEKFIQLPDSQIGKFMREKQNSGFFKERMCFGFGPGMYYASKGKRDEGTSNPPSTDAAGADGTTKNA